MDDSGRIGGGDGGAIAAAVAAVPGLAPARARDLAALLACLHAECPRATTVLGGSLAAGATGARPDVDLFLILPSRLAALRALRSRRLRRRLEALRLGVDAELVVLWEALVRRGRTAVYGRLLTGDRTLADAIARSPAPPPANLAATSHLFLVQSLLEPDRAEWLLAKALATAFRGWVRARDPARTMADLFAPEATRAELARRGAMLAPADRDLIGAALACLAGEPAGWDVAAVRPRALRLLTELGDGDGERRLRRCVRHMRTRRRFGAAPWPLRDPTRVYTAAVRDLVAAAAEEAGRRPSEHGAAGAARPGAEQNESALARAERGLVRLLGARPDGTASERVLFVARALEAYGRDYPHKILLPAPPPVAAPATPATVSFVVPCRNGADTLPGLLDGLAALEAPAGYTLETIVVDNGSTDGSAAIAAARGATVVREPTPGASAARNAGTARARGATVVFLDADARPLDRGFAHHLLRALARPGVGLVGAAVECAAAAGPLGRADHMVSFFNWQPTQLAERRHFHPSVALAARRAVLDSTGGFDEALLSFHDFDFCRRARERGWALHFEPAARVAHVPRRGLAAVVRHSFRWGWNTRRVYAAHDPARRWLFLDRPLLFALNVPWHVANRVWVTCKRWFWRRPLDTVLLFPLLVLLLTAWGAGVARGAYVWLTTESSDN